MSLCNYPSIGIPIPAIDIVALLLSLLPTLPPLPTIPFPTAFCPLDP